MGGSSSTAVFFGDIDRDTYLVIDSQRKLQQSIEVPLQELVAHYTPSIFPLSPALNKANSNFCRDSWAKIVANNLVDPYGGPTTSGMAAFYMEFYNR
jgi:hypothetical protein